MSTNLKSKSFSGQSPKRPHILTGQGISKEVSDLRKDVDSALELFENRDESLDYPELDWVDGAPPVPAGGSVVLRGRNLLQGQTFAGVEIGATTSKLTFATVRPGLAGNDYSVVIEDTGSVTVDLTDNLITIGIDVGTSKANDVATAVNLGGADTKFKVRCVSGGAGLVAVADETPFTGGAGEGWECKISGVDCPPAHATGTSPTVSITETAATVTCADLTAESVPRAAGDTVSVVVNSNSIATQPISLVLATP